MELMNKLWAAAKADKRRIVLPEGDEERTIKSASSVNIHFERKHFFMSQSTRQLNIL